MTDTPASLTDDEVVVLEQQFNITKLSAQLSAQGISLIIRHQASGEQASTSADGGMKSNIQQLADENKQMKRSLQEVQNNLTQSRLEEDELKRKIERLESIKLEMDRTLAIQHQEDEKMRGKVQRLESDKEELTDENKQLKRSLEEVRSSLTQSRLEEEELKSKFVLQHQEWKSKDEKMRGKVQRLESDKEELDMTLTAIIRENTEKSNVIEKIRDAIRCPICALVRNQVVQCENGHHVCIHCQREIFRCPVCRVSYNAGAHKNLVAEDVARALNG